MSSEWYKKFIINETIKIIKKNNWKNLISVYLENIDAIFEPTFTYCDKQSFKSESPNLETFGVSFSGLELKKKFQIKVC